MDLADFAAFHRPALAADEARHTVILHVLSRGLDTPERKLRTWSLGAPGACAVQQHGWGIVLGDIDRAQAEQLARDVAEDNIPSVVGPDETAVWFAGAAMAQNLFFPTVIRQTIHVMEARPTPHDTPGSVRLATSDDLDLVYAWLVAFRDEAVPHDTAPTKHEAGQRISNERVFLWCVDDRPVAMSCVGRVLETGMAIAPVYTPPNERCRGYAGAATAAVAERIFDRGYGYVCLYTDDANPAATRCYARIGFRPHCRSNYYLRAATA